ncbi:protein kinase [Streptomyces xanthii]|uniref:non-specific serine/threonine protein kinase n=2 Tax=Streptomyces xanthii TaxID=2768069 RepID=A0A7H1BJB5_9ACTN|nr:protein kinase [Streptomyces xanthii]QNS08820.1 protein kinase [Streptomyces xanthii]
MIGLSIASCDLVLDRRGSTVWNIVTGSGRYALKLGYPIEATDQWPGQPWTARAPGREAAVLAHLATEHVASGDWERGTWNIQPWHEGPDLQHLWTRTRADGAVPDIQTAFECAGALAELHEAGWAHGDIQPAHFLIGPDRTHLIDLALAHGKPVPDTVDFPFRGCLVHYEAPEISAAVLDEDQAIPTQAADIYGLGATLLMAATGKRAVIYPDNAPRPAQRAAIVAGNRRAVTMPGPMGPLVLEMLRHAPGDRPTAAQALRALAQLT